MCVIDGGGGAGDGGMDVAVGSRSVGGRMLFSVYAPIVLASCL